MKPPHFQIKSSIGERCMEGRRPPFSSTIRATVVLASPISVAIWPNDLPGGAQLGYLGAIGQLRPQPLPWQDNSVSSSEVITGGLCIITPNLKK